MLSENVTEDDLRHSRPLGVYSQEARASYQKTYTPISHRRVAGSGGVGGGN